MSSLAIITARGGSKRIPRKNVNAFLGKPIIQYSIEAAINSNIFDEVMVSTDDQEIAEIALQLGAKVPFMRSLDNSNDFATTADVISEVLMRYNEGHKYFDYTCCLYPTAPFITADKLKIAFQLLLASKADSVIPITKFSFPIWRSFKIEDGFINYIWPENANKRSQDLPDSFHDCGQFYFTKTEEFLKNKKLVTQNTIGLIVPESEVQDIDNLEDWEIAEIKYRYLLEKTQFNHV
jgi:N-acylneuraminate cytidylyltransferase